MAHAELSGQLPGREPTIGREPDGDRIPGGQTGDGTAQQTRQLVGFDQGLRSGVHRFDLHRGFVIQLAVAARNPMVINDDVFRDGPDPGPESGGVPELIEVLERPGEHLLDHIGNDVLVTAGASSGHPLHPRGMGPVQLGERPGGSAASGDDQCPITPSRRLLPDKPVADRSPRGSRRIGGGARVTPDRHTSCPRP